MKFSCLLIMSLFMKCFANPIITSDDKTYLLKPTGNYRIGYQDLYLINDKLCPDKMYQKNVNESNFANSKFCHEIIVRIYYPSNERYSVGDLYDSTYLSEANKWYKSYYKLSESEFDVLNSNININTFTVKYAQPIKNKKFPALLFLPGSGQSVYTYNNIVSNLVSHGYIVIGINSVFANGPLMLSSGKIVSWPDKYNDDARLENLDDFKDTIIPNVIYIQWEQ